jgi:hypothetical protein
MKKMYRKLKRLIRYVPVIWNSEDFDYRYALELFQMKLEDISDFLESDKAMSTDAKHYASRIRMILRLMDKVYNEEYSTSYFDELKSLYGDGFNEWRFIPHGDGDKLYGIRFNWEDWDNAYEIRVKQHQLWKASIKKQKRAHKLLWELVEHNILNWWD